jgi:hypothetical protein
LNAVGPVSVELAGRHGEPNSRVTERFLLNNRGAEELRQSGRVERNMNDAFLSWPSVNEDFVIWTSVIGSVLWILYYLIRRHNAHSSIAAYNVQVGPLLLAIFWLYGCLFNWGNAGQFAQYFNLEWPSYYYEYYPEHLWIFCGMVLATIIPVALMIHVRAVFRRRSVAVGADLEKQADGVVLPFLALVAWYLAAQVGRYLPNTILTWKTYMGRDTFSGILSYPDFALPSALLVVFTLVAYTLTRLSIRAPARDRLSSPVSLGDQQTGLRQLVRCPRCNGQQPDGCEVCLGSGWAEGRVAEGRLDA